MAVLDFPSNPNIGDTYNNGETIWTFNGVKWVAQSGLALSLGYTGSRGDIGYTGSQGVGYTGSQGDIGYTGSKGNDGNFGGATFAYNYAGTSDDFDPSGLGSTGDLRLDAAPSTATQIFIDDLDANGDDIQTFLRTIDDSTSTIKGHVKLSSKFDAGRFALFTISSVTENAGWFTINVAYVSGDATVAASGFNTPEAIIATFARTGDRGDLGYTGSKGDIGYTGSQGVYGWVTKTANYTAVNLDALIANTSGGAFTITLPTTPSAGDTVVIADGDDFSTNNLTVARNGSTIEGAAQDFILDIQHVRVDFVYDGSTWQAFPTISASSGGGVTTTTAGESATARYIPFVDNASGTVNETVRVDAALSFINNSAAFTGRQQLTVGQADASVPVSIRLNGNNNGGNYTPELIFYDGDTAASTGQKMGRITFQSADTGANGLARIEANVVGGLDPNDGSRIIFSTLDNAGSYAERLQITETGALKIATSYTLPTTDGTAGQVLTTDGLGAVTFADAGGASTLTIDNKTGAYTVVAGDLGKIINCTSGTFTISLTAAATLGAGFEVTIWNTSSTTTHVITIDPNGAETIDGTSTLVLSRGEGMQIVCDGTNWQTGNKKTMRGYAENIATNQASPTATGAGSVAIGHNSSAAGSAAAAFYGSAGAGGSTAIGVNSGYAYATTVTGVGSTALGGSYASGTDSFAAAIANNTSSYGATGANSVAIGKQAKATNSGSIAIATTAAGGAVASGSSAFAVGANILAAGASSVVMGYNSSSCSSAPYSTAIGINSSAVGRASFAINGASTREYNKFGGGFGQYQNSAGQWGILPLYAITTDDTPLPLLSQTTLNGNAIASTNNQIIVPNNSAYGFTGMIVARENSASTNDFAVWEIKGGAVRGATAATIQLGTYNINKISESAGAANWSIALSADTTNGAVAITVTGEVAHDIRWVAAINTAEVTY